MIIILNFGSTTPPHSELDKLAESCRSALWEYAMIGFRDEPVERLASRVSQLVYDSVINYFSSNPYLVDPRYDLADFGIEFQARFLGHEKITNT